MDKMEKDISGKSQNCGIVGVFGELDMTNRVTYSGEWP